jgi:hypothetical protein
MDSTCDADYLRLAQAIPSGTRVQDAMKGLDHFFDFGTTAGGSGWSEIKVPPEGSKALWTVRTAFWADFDELEKVANTLLSKDIC